MVTIDVSRLSATTRYQYTRAFQWLQRNYDGAYDRTEPIQEFISNHKQCSGLRGRILQALFFEPFGPSVRSPRSIVTSDPHRWAPPLRFSPQPLGRVAATN